MECRYIILFYCEEEDDVKIADKIYLKNKDEQEEEEEERALCGKS